MRLVNLRYETLLNLYNEGIIANFIAEEQKYLNGFSSIMDLRVLQNGCVFLFLQFLHNILNKRSKKRLFWSRNNN